MATTPCLACCQLIPVDVSYGRLSERIEYAELVMDASSSKSKLAEMFPYGVAMPLPGLDAYSGGGVSGTVAPMVELLLLCKLRVRRRSLKDWRMEGIFGMRLWTTAGRTWKNMLAFGKRCSIVGLLVWDFVCWPRACSYRSRSVSMVGSVLYWPKAFSTLKFWFMGPQAEVYDTRAATSAWRGKHRNRALAF
jgi:hypothetical protein